MSFYYTLEFYKVYIHSKKRLNDMFRSLIVNSYYKLLSLYIRNEFVRKKSLAHGQALTKFSLARLEKPLSPGVGQWDLSAPENFLTKSHETIPLQKIFVDNLTDRTYDLYTVI